MDKTEFYQHDQNWSNRMILGDSLQVMASLAEREGLRGKVQCIYLDPPYGIKFNCNFQWSTTSRDVKDGNAEHITREPEQVKAFRDTWRDGIHSYLTYLRDRLTVARDLLTESGSIFVQIGDENVHRVRAVMDEVFGDDNFVSTDRLSEDDAIVSDAIYSASYSTTSFGTRRSRQQLKYPTALLDERPCERRSDGNTHCVETADWQHRRMIDAQSGRRCIDAAGRLRVVPHRQSDISASTASNDELRSSTSRAARIDARTRVALEDQRDRDGTTRCSADRLEPIGNSLDYVRFFDDFRRHSH